MSDLDVMIRRYYDSAASAVEAEEIMARSGSELQPPHRRFRLRAGWYALAAAVVVLVAVGGSTMVLRGGGEETGAGQHAEPVTLSDGTWARTDIATGFEVYDLRSTSFGLVAAAGADGVWISPEGTEWRQALVAPYEPPEKTWEGEPARRATYAEIVAEHEAVLYAFGSIWTDPDGSEGPDGDVSRVVWRSEDGRSWEEIEIEGFPQQIDVAAGPDGLLLIGREVKDVDLEGPPELSTVIYGSPDGKEWTRISTSGLDEVVLWAISRLGDGYVALGEEPYDNGIVFHSSDAVTWAKVGPWTVKDAAGQPQPMNFSVWALVDLFESPYGVIVVGTPEPWNIQGAARENRPTVVLAESIDGRTFETVDQQTGLFQLEDERENRWPPLRPPQGTTLGNRIMLLGHSYPNTSAELTNHQWVWTPPQT